MTYSRDRAGRLTSETSAGPAVPASNRRYGYTKLGQLCFDTPTIDTTSTCAAPGVGATPYTYDTADNLTRSITNTQQKYNAADQLCWTLPTGTSTNTCATTPAGGSAYSYDTRGNRATAGSTSYTYDQVNRLTQTTGAVTGAGNNGEYIPVTPARLLDTRTIGNPITGGSPIAAGGTVDLGVLGAGGPELAASAQTTGLAPGEFVFTAAADYGTTRATTATLDGIAAWLLETFVEVVKIGGKTLHHVAYEQWFAPFLSPVNASLGYSLAFDLVMFAFAYLLYRKQWFLKL